MLAILKSKYAIGGIVALCLLAVAFASGWAAQGWRKDAEISAIKAEQARADAAASDAALADLVAATGVIKAAASDAAKVRVDVSNELKSIWTQLEQNAIPLPDNCRPDPVRVHGLEAAIDSANEAAAR